MPSASFTVFVNAFVFVSATEFLRGMPKTSHEHVSVEEVRSSLVNEIEDTLGKGNAVHRLDTIEALLKPIFLALPKNEHGKLGHAAGRYTLNRLFVLRHGWKIKGIDSRGGAWNSSSPAAVLKEQVPAYVQDFFEERLGGQGLGLHELAILASTIEHLIHKETFDKLRAAFKVHDLPWTGELDEATANDVLDTYVMAYIIGESLTNMTLPEAQLLKAQMPDMFVAWRNTQSFVRSIRANVAQHTEIDFEAMNKIADAVGEEFGSFFSTQCLIMKEKLVRMGDGGRGRVLLTDFYRSHLNGSWQFQESVAYLRQLGALDESDPKAMSVIIPNYVYSQSNCIPSGFYSICCKDECTKLMGHLEEKLATPGATPEAIKALVKELASSTMPSPVIISPALSDRLEDIAKGHGGLVPLHGRLFAQWMHRVYPRECPFPHISGRTSQQAPEEWIVESGTDAFVTQEEMLRLDSASNETHFAEANAIEEAVHWSPDEELLVVCAAPNLASKESTTKPGLRSVVFFGAIVSVAFGLLQSLRGMPAGTPSSKVFV